MAEPDMPTGPGESLSYDVLGWSARAGSSHCAQFGTAQLGQQGGRPESHPLRLCTSLESRDASLVLKLHNNAIIRTISLTRLQKDQPCHWREFTVYGALCKDNMVKLLHSSLQGGAKVETSFVRRRANGIPLVSRYVMIETRPSPCLASVHSQWAVALTGHVHCQAVSLAATQLQNHLEQESVRLCLRHLRQNGLNDAFTALQRQTGVVLESDRLSVLHHTLVDQGDFEACERIIKKAAANGSMSEYVANAPYTPVWTRICPVAHDTPRPGPRGGHQMCIDVERHVLYMFGGWNGWKDCGDLWQYHIEHNTWSCLSVNTHEQGGPSPRSCHKMCLDTDRQLLYILGRFVDTENCTESELKADFYCYDIGHDRWTCLSEDTRQDGGPELVFDHQMCMEQTTDTVYVFGGKVLQRGHATRYSGLYSYHCRTRKWTLLRGDHDQSSDFVQLKARLGHSMLLEPAKRLLYIFAGQRLKKYLSDFYVYSLESNTVLDMWHEPSGLGGPEANFTQRVTIDPERREIYFLSGLVIDKNRQVEDVKSFWGVFSIDKQQWKQVIELEQSEGKERDMATQSVPCPRYAHQMVLDTSTRTHYVFGGNAGGNPQMRLDDFWSMRLHQPSLEDVTRHALFLIRRQRFMELCRKDPVVALNYLQCDLSSAVDFSQSDEVQELQALPLCIFTSQAQSSQERHTLAGLIAERTKLYQSLEVLFPSNERQPSASLSALVASYL